MKGKLNFKFKKGFTLIELLIVIAVVAVLATIVVVAVNSAREKAKLAKAKLEVGQIMRAAELVFNDYGYYPPDPHNSPPTCPKDIQITVGGKKWSDYLNICNDPWGNPYEWDNLCPDGSGGTKRRNDSGGPTCLKFSDANPGPVGIVVVGVNGVNNSCTGDDLCIGDRGHQVYGWTGDTTSGGGTSGMCVTTVATCAEIGVVGCNARTGCDIFDSSCSGEYSTSCVGLAVGSCNAPCTWLAGGCSGPPGPAACSFYTASGACGTAGCSWSSTCSAAVDCTRLSTSDSCTDAGAGCTWSGSCGGTSTCSTYNSNQISCNNFGCAWGSACVPGSSTVYGCAQFSQANCAIDNHECYWTGTACSPISGSTRLCTSLTNCSPKPSQCNLNPNRCTGIKTCANQTPEACTSFTGCSVSGGSCTGSQSCDSFTPAKCSTYESAGCIPGSTCEGSPKACTEYVDDLSCTGASCTWGGAASCVGSIATSCSGLNKLSCQGKPGECTWSDGRCDGSAKDCTDFTTSGECIEFGCRWE